jgi:hypothetical protein
MLKIMVAVVIISLILFLVVLFYILTKENSKLSSLKKEYKNLKLDDVIYALSNLKRDGVFIDEKFISEVATYFAVNKESIIDIRNSEIISDSINELSVGDMFIKSGKDYKKALNSIFYCFFIELILLVILYEVKSVGGNTAEGKGYEIGIFIIIILVGLMFSVYYFINKYNAANYLKMAGEKMNLNN